MAALRAWAPQRSIGARVDPADAVLREGETLLVQLGPVAAPVRVVRVVDEPDRFGYAYGTLPGHPERGEELFLVERTASEVVASIVIDAEPAWLLARAAAPLVRWLQRAAVGRYLRSLMDEASALASDSE